MNQQQGSDRRGFHLAMIYGLWGVITSALTLPAAVYLLFPPKVKKATQWVDAADLAQIQPKAPEEVVFRKNRVDGWKVTSEKSTAWVVKLTDNQAVAFSPQCTHLGCAYHWDENNKNFLCPCHTSTFDMEGNVLSGPAPRPLDRFQVRVEGTKLLIGDLQKPENV
ncbi:MAG: ubiquinol-cytochrome c reductase iron-sulfur subunit [Bryobacteraceae bacterium]